MTHTDTLSPANEIPPEEILEQISHLIGEEERQRFFSRRPDLITVDQVSQLCAEVVKQVQIDAERALELAATARFVANALDDDQCRALAARAAANAYHFSGDYALAQDLYGTALGRFEALGDALGGAVTRSSALHNLGYLGDYETAFAWEASARATFERLGDRSRLASLDNNMANVLHRQARWREALERYRSAYEEFQRLGRAEAAAVCLNNVAACHIDLHHLEEATEIYRQSREYCAQQGLHTLVMEVDYHLGQLSHLRAEYTQAIAHLQAARRTADASDDVHQRALCDLALSEIYLELNLVGEALELARSAHAGFDRLKMPYEAAKALTNLAIAHSRDLHTAEALELLHRARRIFVAEQNQHWPALIDFYRAVVLARAGEPVLARDAARLAYDAFSHHGLDSRAVMCLLLLARLAVDLARHRAADTGADHDELAAARDLCIAAMERLQTLDLPALEQRAYLVLGQVEEARGHLAAARDAFEHCERCLERMRDQLRGEDLKISFFQDKRQVYESLVILTFEDVRRSRQEPTTPQVIELECAAPLDDVTLSSTAGEARHIAAITYIERAKSRSLADLMAFQASELPAKSGAGSDVAERARQLREELRFTYHQIDRQQMDGAKDGADPKSRSALERLRRRGREVEDQLLRTQRELAAEDQELGSLQAAATIDLDQARASLGADTQLIDFFIARDRIFAALLDHTSVHMVEVASAARVRELHRLLQFQLSRRAGLERHPARGTHGFERLIHRATQLYLRELYDLLVRPLEGYIDASRLIIAPHDFLHYLPFHALDDGDGALMDRFDISFAPSAHVFHLGALKGRSCQSGALVLGVADERAPHILDEVRAVAEGLPGSQLLEGPAASQAALREHAAACRYVHIATHGIFRPDNPMFSAIQLGDSRLSLFDLYNLRLDADLVVLSGCGTGLNAVQGADELVGLSRGLLFAGARSLLVSLWDVHDASTAHFMRRFYGHLTSGMERVSALRRTMIEHRDAFPEPYFWAPLVLVGQPD